MGLTILDLPDAGFDVIERQVGDLLLEGVEVHDGQILRVPAREYREGVGCKGNIK